MNSICETLKHRHSNLKCEHCSGSGSTHDVKTIKKGNLSFHQHESIECFHCKGTGIGLKFDKIEHQEIFFKVLKLLQKISNSFDSDDVYDIFNEAFDVHSIVGLVPQAVLKQIEGTNLMLFGVENHGIITNDNEIVSIY